MKRMVAWTGLALLVLAGLWCWALMLRPAWIEPIEGVRLEPARPILRESDVRPDSAYDLFRRAIDLPSFDRTGVDDEWKQMQETGWNDAYINLASAIFLCASNVDLARRAALAPNPQVPTITNFAMPLHHLGKAHILARLLQTDAYRKSATGEYQEAAKNLVAGIRFGDIVSRGGLLMHRLVSDGIGRYELDAIQALAARDKWPHALLRIVIRELTAIDANLEPFAECLRQKYVATPSAINDFYSGNTEVLGLEESNGMQAIRLGAPLLGSTRAETQRNMRYAYGHFIALAEKEYDEDAYRRLYDWKMPGDEIKQLVYYRDPVGHFLAFLFFFQLNDVHASHLSFIARLHVTRLALALRIYSDEEGALPETLEALTPRYLDAVPADPFDGRPLRYRRVADTTWRLYSVGRNGRDDGGVGDANTPLDGLDLVFTSE